MNTKVAPTPDSGGGLSAVLHGDLAAILTISEEGSAA